MAVNDSQRSGAASREAILDAAEELMAAHGFSAASISRIERASGLPASSIYWHFGSKDGVLMAVMKRGADRFFASLPPASDFDGSPLEQIDAALRMAGRLLDEHPQFLQLLITLGLQHGEGDPQVMELVRDVRRQARERLEQAIHAALDDVPQGERDEAAAQLARVSLALGDGWFIARTVDRESDAGATFGRLGPAIAALIGARRRA
jgi:AcrR family transcriptional regulator